MLKQNGSLPIQELVSNHYMKFIQFFLPLIAFSYVYSFIQKKIFKNFVRMCKKAFCYEARTFKEYMMFFT